MIVVKRANDVIHSDAMNGNEYIAINPILTEEKNKVPTLSFQIAYGNNVYDSIKNGDIITAEENGSISFRGRVDKISMDFRKTKKIDCVGEFTFMIDTVIRPFDAFTGTVQQMLTALVTSHNVCADSDKQFVVGDVENVGFHEFKNENFVSTMDYIQNNIIKAIGGSVYFDSDQNGNRRINYKYTPAASTQIIMYGQNMLDMSNSVDYADVYTVLLPVGKNGLTISSVTGGSDFLANEEAVNLYGRRWKVINYDTEDAQELFDMAIADVNKGALVIPSMSIKAFDLSNMGVGIEQFQVGHMVNIYSEVHGLDLIMEVQKITRNLLNPTNSEITIGDTSKGMSSRVQATEKSIEQKSGGGIGYPVKRTDLAIDVQNSLNMFDMLGLSVVNGKIYDTWEEEE